MKTFILAVLLLAGYTLANQATTTRTDDQSHGGCWNRDPGYTGHTEAAGGTAIWDGGNGCGKCFTLSYGGNQLTVIVVNSCMDEVCQGNHFDIVTPDMQPPFGYWDNPTVEFWEVGC